MKKYLFICCFSSDWKVEERVLSIIPRESISSPEMQEIPFIDLVKIKKSANLPKNFYE